MPENINNSSVKAPGRPEAQTAAAAPAEQPGNDQAGNERQPARKPRRPLWARLLKWTGITLATVLALFIIVCSLIVWVLTPPRLTPLVSKEASKYLNADVKASRVELFFWKTFPQMHLEVDSLTVVSRSLSGLTPGQQAALPADADTLLTIRGFRGGVNVLKLLTGSIHLTDVVFDSPSVNLLQVTDSIANYQIFPVSEETDTTEMTLPDITIDRFRILSSGPLRFRSMIDSLDVTAWLRNVNLDGAGAPQYALTFAGNADLPFLRDYALDSLSFALDGRLDWNAEKPLALTASDMKLTLADYTILFSTDVDFTHDPLVNSFRASIDGLPVQTALRNIPAALQQYVKPLTTDMLLSATIEFTRPWALADTILPSAHATLTVPRCKARYETLDIDMLQGDVSLDFDGARPDKSVYYLNNLQMAGAGVNFTLRGTATNVMTDPYVTGTFRGSVDLGRIPARLAQRIPVQLKGRIGGDADFRLNLSDLNEESFHRIFADGSVTLDNISANAPGMMEAWLHHGELRFGTTDSFVHAGHKVDSLLQVSLKIDTLHADGMGMNLQLRDLKAGVGTVNRSGSADTTEINPFGGSVAVNLLKFDATSDTMRVRLRDTRIGGALRRYKGNARSPQLDVRILSDRMMFGQALTKFSLRETNMALTVYMRDRGDRPKFTEEERAARRAQRQARDSVAMAEAKVNGDIDMTLDKKDRNLLRRWDYNGTLTATRGRVVTPYFPLRNTLRNVDLKFSSDSIQLTNLLYTAGQSDFLINGTISNVRRALTARTDNTLGVIFDVKSDSINVNEIVRALFAGTGEAKRTDPNSIWDDSADNNATDITVAPGDSVPSGPLLIPHNIDVRLRMGANHILYSDLLLHAYKGELLVYDGAVNLRNLSASTDIGSLAVNGLYTSTNSDSLQFALGMRVNRFLLGRLSSLVPAIDTLMPVMQQFSGIVNADIAVTTDLHRNMDIDIPSLRAMIKIVGDSLVLLDAETFKTVSKWLLFKNKKHNMIDHMEVEAQIENSVIELYPFIFDIDRYRLGVMGHNDMAMNLNYHVSVLKSPLPFKFGINIKGTPEKMKVRLGGAKVKNGMVGERQTLAADTRINLVQQIDNMFRRGVRNARSGRLRFRVPEGGNPAAALEQDLETEDVLSYADSLRMIRAGLIENPDTLRYPMHDPEPEPALTGRKAGHSKAKGAVKKTGKKK